MGTCHVLVEKRFAHFGDQFAVQGQPVFRQLPKCSLANRSELTHQLFLFRCLFVVKPHQPGEPHCNCFQLQKVRNCICSHHCGEHLLRLFHPRLHLFSRQTSRKRLIQQDKTPVRSLEMGSIVGCHSEKCPPVVAVGIQQCPCQFFRGKGKFPCLRRVIEEHSVRNQRMQTIALLTAGLNHAQRFHFFQRRGTICLAPRFQKRTGHRFQCRQGKEFQQILFLRLERKDGEQNVHVHLERMVFRHPVLYLPDTLRPHMRRAHLPKSTAHLRQIRAPMCCPVMTAELAEKLGHHGMAVNGIEQFVHDVLFVRCTGQRVIVIEQRLRLPQTGERKCNVTVFFRTASGSHDQMARQREPVRFQLCVLHAVQIVQNHQRFFAAKLPQNL